MMTLQEKSLYQQIHPLRLFTDWASGLYACYLFWYGEVTMGIILAFAPSLLVSLLVIRTADLDKIKRSTFGRYFARTYSKTIDLIRFGGFVLMAGSSWYHSIEGMAAGFAVIAGTWTYGVFTLKNISENK